MRGNQNLQFSLLVAATAAALASAQAPQLTLPADDPPQPAQERERVTVSDAQLGLEVQGRLSQELGVNVSAIVRYGVVTLDGIVRTDADLKRAEELALEVHGVHKVVNELNVAQPLSIAIANDAAADRAREGTDIELAVTSRLNEDAVLGSRPIQVVVDALTNTVTLTGRVSTPDEKDRAGQIAVAAFPAGQVRNQLEVQQRL
jgi:osmotically-inducible protein OsmY